MEINLLVTAAAAIIPLFIGFIWYNPKVFGNTWMKECGFNLSEIKAPNPIIYLWCYLLSFLAALTINFLVIHQWGIFSTLIDEPGFMEQGSEIQLFFQDFMSKYGTNFRTFNHGSFHGLFAGLTLAFPILGTNAMFEQKSFKYVLINGGYWTVTFALMGGVICQFT
ncbi:DUF1761 domain-containing protein [Flavobacteriaceae bacterium]|nr:DUF1761 domain-containing protein [Flavobacteriaceae bacterium]